jgi:hypothetical protein
VTQSALTECNEKQAKVPCTQGISKFSRMPSAESMFIIVPMKAPPHLTSCPGVLTVTSLLSYTHRMTSGPSIKAMEELLNNDAGMSESVCALNLNIMMYVT